MKKKEDNKLNIQYNLIQLPEDFPIRAFLKEKKEDPIDLNEDVDYMHFHNCLEIGYCYVGDGYAYVEKKVLTHTSNDVMIIPPYTAHITKDKVDGNQQFASIWEYIYVDTKLLLSDFYPEGFPGYQKFVYDSATFENILSGSKYPVIVELVRAILNEIRYKRYNYETTVKGMVLSLFVMISRIISDINPSDNLKHKSILSISPVVDYININSYKHLNSEFLARLCHMSVTNFRRVFKEIMGFPPYDYINRIRIAKARNLLYITDESILSISLQVGYNSVSSFNRFFFEYAGIPPLKWRKTKRASQKMNYSKSAIKLTLKD
ncbi:MAG TPA: AraC family transcriptional regulator [Clostridiaceae bacterium]